MRRQARITSKGQITVPHEIRKFLGVKAGDQLVFETSGTRAHVRPLRKSSPFGAFRGIGNGEAKSGRTAILQRLRELRGQ